MKRVFLFIAAVLFSVFGYARTGADYGEANDEREQQIYFYYQQGLKADNGEKDKSSIGDALRYYYWSLMLCYSSPQGSTVKITDPDTGYDLLAREWLYDRINTLLGRIEFTLKKKPVIKNKDGVAYELIVTDGFDKIPWLSFEYNNGNEIVESSVESGMASVVLVDKGINNFDIHICVDNKKDAEANAQDVYDVMKRLGPISFAAATKNIDVKKAKEGFEDVEYQDSTILVKKIETDKFIDEKAFDNISEYEKAMKVVEKAVRNKDIDVAKWYFSKDGFEMFKRLLDNGRYYILGTPEYKFIEFKDMVICRSIPMQFNFRNNVGFIRNIVFRFDKNTQKIVSIAFRLTDIAELDILGKDQWDANSRMILVNFLEDYQTAYALKRQEYLDKIFSDDALIIVGTVLKQKQKGDNMHLSMETMVRYDTLSKCKYMEKLRGVFSRNEFVNIRFLDTEFSQHKSGLELYGIQIKQEYLSSSYGDVGYLFLMVDLRDELPVIHVRTWEPEKTENPICFDDIVVEML